jgi:2,4-dienoyl-CoA reductase-like NADH-dependent reductase (Old Yellow Enzyme family)/thioredoxin reductase
MEKQNFSHLFQPLQVRNMTIKNRIVMTPMGTNYGSQNGEISDDHINYYELRARGGTGLIIVENAGIDFPLGSNGTTQIRIDHDSFLPQLYRLTEKAHDHGACIAVQINHAGASAMSSRTGMQPVSASAVPSKTGGEVPRPLEKTEIIEIVKKYGQAAKRAQIAGFDSVEIHAGHSYLISQFLSSLTNKRTDEFGGSIENRSRFAKMVIEEVRAQVGPHFPLIMRVSADEFLEGGNTLEDTLKYLEIIGDEIDIFDVSAGLNGSIHKQIDASFYEDGWRSYMARAVKEHFNKPCISMGNIRDPKVAEAILERKDADLIGIGRGLIADPDWANKTAKGMEDTIRKCISCNIGCAGNRIGNNRPIRCTVNPATLTGEIYKKQCVRKPCNVVIIGGGTAGLEAACTAAEVGCSAFLIEKEPVLGGLAAEISKIPEKKRLADFPNYLIHRAKSLKNLTIFTGLDPSIDFIKNLNPNIIVTATGSLPLLPPIKGLHEHIDQNGGNVFSITGMIKNIDVYGNDLSGKKVVVIGGGAVGLDVVEFFAPRGATVDIVEMMSIIGNGLDPVSKVQMATMMDEHHVTQWTNTALLEVTPSAFIVKNPDGSHSALEFDYGFVCLGMKAYTPLYDKFTAAFAGEAEVLNIGDSLKARRIIEGVHEGRNILSVLEREGYL